jgi:hypothetical protein
VFGFEGEESDEPPLFILSENPLIPGDEDGNVVDLGTPTLPYTPTLNAAYEDEPVFNTYENDQPMCVQCHKRRPAARCDNKMCKADCIANGGCSYRDHPMGQAPLPSPSITQLPRTVSQCTKPVEDEDITSAFDSHHPNNPSSSPSSSPSPASLSLTQPALNPGFRFFTPLSQGLIAGDSRLNNHLAARSRKANALKAKTTISTFLWEMDALPLAQIFQSSLADGHFVIDEVFLNSVGLPSDTSILHFYSYRTDAWQIVRIGFAISISKLLKQDDIPVVMLKLPAVKAPQGLHSILPSKELPSSHSLTPSLAEQRRLFKQERNTAFIADIDRLHQSLSTPRPVCRLTPLPSTLNNRTLPQLNHHLTPFPSTHRVHQEPSPAASSTSFYTAPSRLHSPFPKQFQTPSVEHEIID